MKKLKLCMVYILLSFISKTFPVVNVVFINNTGSPIKIKIEDPESVDYKSPLKLDLHDLEIYFLENAKGHHRVSFAKRIVGNAQQLFMGKQYDNNHIAISPGEGKDLLVIISRFGMKECNYIKIILREDEANQYKNASKDMYAIGEKVAALWKNIERIKTEKDAIEDKIKLYFTEKEKTQRFGGEIVEWSKKITVLRDLFLRGHYRVRNLNDHIYKKIKKLKKYCRIVQDELCEE